VGLAPLPESFPATRESLHRVAEQIVAPARKPHNEIALMPTPGGFGTPPFEFQGHVLQVHVDGVELVVAEDGVERRLEPSSLADAASFVGAGLYFDGVPTDETPLALDSDAAERLADLYSFAATALEALRSGSSIADEPSAIILWPEHFDVAFDAGTDDGGGRATFGVSPGDEHHPGPYLYVAPWRERRRGAGDVWNANGFAGAELAYAELVGAADAFELAREFFSGRREALGH
jgi:hypothetical protein